jgi:hypothetical protein
MVHKIEIDNKESRFLCHALNLAYNVINGAPSDLGLDATDPSAKHFLGLILDGREQLLRDAADNDKAKANQLWNSVSKKITDVTI